jgi:uncharacterized peroxidase-related enzyme
MRLRGLAPQAKVYDLFAHRPDIYEPFTIFCEKLMRGSSALTPGARELIGTFVSALNSCRYCHDVHAEAVRAYGIDPELIRALRDDPATAPIEARYRPLLALARRVTESAQRVTDGDFEACRAAGWDEGAIHDAVVVACLFNFMNRLVSAFDIEADAAYLAAAGPRLRDQGYAFSLVSATQSVPKSTQEKQS